MTSSEDFKQAIRKGNINEAFLVAMSNAPELNITTRIISADGHSTDVGSSEIDNYLHTHINLVEGKVENEISEKLTGDRYIEIEQFHLQQVAQGHQTIQQNLVSLQKMFQLMSSFQQQQISNHSNWVDIAADVTNLPTDSEPEQLYGKVPNALQAGVTNKTDTSNTQTDLNSQINPEPQLPSFEAEDEAVEELLSLVDLDEDENEDSKQQPESESSDWSEWLDDEPDVPAKVFDLKSLNVNKAKENWQNWQSPNHDRDSQSPED